MTEPASGGPAIPDALLIGAMRSGTTTLATALDRSPDIQVSEPKEPNWWTTNAERPPSWYAARWPSAVGIRLDASTSATREGWSEHVAARLATAAPGVRIVYLVREPWSRTTSHWQFHVRRYGERRPLGVALREQPDYLMTSMYGRQLTPWLDRFSAEQIMVVTTDWLAADPRAAVAAVASHLGGQPPSEASEESSAPEALNQGRELATWPRPLRRVRRRAGAAAKAWGRLPSPVRAGVRRLLTVAAPRPDDRVDAAHEREARQELAEDCRRIAHLVTGPTPLWLRAGKSN